MTDPARDPLEETTAVSRDAAPDAVDGSASEETGPGAASVGDATAPAAAPAGPHPVLVYTLLRAGVLVAVGAVLYLVGLRGAWLLLFAFLVSGVVSAFVLSRPREGAALGITRAVRGINERIDASARAEDDDVDDGAPPAPSA